MAWFVPQHHQHHQHHIAMIIARKLATAAER
jgi:hypothetical protein